MRGSSMSMERKDFAISIKTLLFLIEVILPGLTAYGLSAALFSDVAECGHLFSRVVADAGFSSALFRLFFSPSFILALIHAVFTQMHTTMCVISFATLYRVGPFRAPAFPATFFEAVATTGVGGYVLVLWSAFWLLDRRGDLEKPLMLLGGGAVYLGGTVCMAVVCHLVSAVPVLKDASDTGFGAMRRRLALVNARQFWAAAAVLALLDCIFVPLAVLTATATGLSQVLAAGTAINAVLCTMVVVMLVAQPMLYLVLWDNSHLAFWPEPAKTPATATME